MNRPYFRNKNRLSARLFAAAIGALAIAATVQSALAQDPTLIAQTPPHTPAEQAKMFHLPKGFRIELVASEPDIVKPINMNFDASGRLLVTQSYEYPYAAPGDRKGRDTIRLITDSDGNGIPDRVTIFADGLNIPIGVTPIADGVLGYSIPNLYRFPDANHDGHADDKVIAYREFGFGDTHGMSSSLKWWIDGWVYGCHGFANTSTIQGADHQAVTMNSGNTYRLRSDGSHIEQYTHGQVNPFGMSIDPLGNVYTSDCHSRPIYMLVRGAYYPSFGKPHDGLGFGPEMMQHSHNSTGIAGAVYYSADQLPEDYIGTMFVVNPVTGRINHDRLEAHGSSYKAIELPDFVSCDDQWFRPVDLQIAPDGSLYVADFYNSIIGHYEVPLDHPLRDKTRGRIWRISYAGDGETPKPQVLVPDLTRSTVDELIKLLGHHNLLLRVHATHQLVHRIGQPAVAAVRAMLAGTSLPEQRAHGLWVLARLGALDKESALVLASDDDRLVRVHMVKAMAEREKWEPWERTLIFTMLADIDPFVRRAAAEAVGRHPHADNVAALLELWRKTPADDEMLVHTTRIALRDTVQNLKNITSLAKQFHDDGDTLRRLAEIDLGIGSPDSAAFLLDYYLKQSLPEGKVAEVLQHVGRNVDDGSRVRFDDLVERFQKADPNTQYDALLTACYTKRERGSDLNEQQRTWAGELAVTLLLSSEEPRARKGIEFARELRLAAAADALARLSGRDSAHAGLRSTAVDALVSINADRGVAIIGGILNDTNSPDQLRQQMAESLGRVDSPAARDLLVSLFKVAHEEVAVAVARSLAGSREGAKVLIAAVEKGQASPRLLQDRVVDERLKHADVENLSARLAKLLEGLPPGDERLRKLVATRKAAFTKSKFDVAQGQKLFEKNCSVCHQLNGKGKKVGPELDGIGIRGLDRLLEDVLDPNRNVDANFRSTIVALDDGQLVTGLVAREEGQVLIVINDKGEEQRISHSQIDGRRDSKLSPMPANVSELMNETEFCHLMAFLLDQRRKVEKAEK